MAWPRRHWTTENPSEMHRCYSQHLRLLILETHVTQKKPIYYRGLSWIRTIFLQTEETPPPAICPARSVHTTEIV